MILFNENTFRLDTANTTYMFRITKFGHLEHVYYGASLETDDLAEVLAQKRTAVIGNSVDYDESDEYYNLDNICLEWSDNGRGDYRQSPAEIKMPDGSFISDFIYDSHDIQNESIPMKGLPSAYEGDQTLVVNLKDTAFDVIISLYYTVFEKANVITRRAVLTNNSPSPLHIRRFMSMMVDLHPEKFNMYTLDGGWIKEAHLNRRNVEHGIIINSSNTGNSSSRHNPAFMLAEERCTEDNGRVFGFNLIYSGNHQSSVDKNGRDIIRVLTGINPHLFEWELNESESFETPEAVMTFSYKGFNGMSHNMHYFVNNHIVRGQWKNHERPVLFNNWEATFFNFDEGKLIKLAKNAKELGAELFVLDDGWFGERNSDNAGLGDYNVNTKKLPNGLKKFADKIRSMGLDFGLWFEPEMVNPNSDLYRIHPEYAVKHPTRKPVLGRNQLVLDLCKKEVRDYIVENVSRILDESNISYVKWDMNRNIAEAYSSAIKNQGEFYHRYILGLYEILSRIFDERPNILLESCASGGNRFDLGMLCFSPQIWASDDTDPIERLKIQTGLSHFYPLSTVGSHVSQAPHQQTLRDTPLSTRFNVSAFGCLGYELDIKNLSPEEKKDIANQIDFYKKYRKIYQFGTFSRISGSKQNKVLWQVVDEEKKTALSGFFQTQVNAAEGDDKLIVKGLNKGRYNVRARPQHLYLGRFGELLKHIMPVEIKPDGFVMRMANRHFSLADSEESFKCSSHALESGIPLSNQFMGTGYNKNLRILGDFGSYIYITERIDD
ncbi:MAG: alpha-galactosidase [Clostridiaceae bacterium]|nr:alpha-galactosidase [Clostridiaceae bacterium]